MDEVIRVVHTFYSTPSDADRAVAQHWLESFQTSHHAWTACICLLSSDSGAPPFVSFFAAQTIKQKTVGELAQLDDAGIRELVHVLEDLVLARKLNQSVCTQLLLALAAIYVQTRLPIDSGKYAEVKAAFLEFLAVLPEQLNNRLIHLSEEQIKERRKTLLHDNAPWAIPMFLSAIVQSRAGERQLGVAALESWLRFADDVLKGNLQLADSVLVNSLHLLQDEDTVQSACQVIIELSYCCEDVPPYVEKFLVEGIPRMTAILYSSAGSEESVKWIGNAVIECGELFLKTAIDMFKGSNPRPLEQLISGALFLSSQSELEVVEGTFNFWSELQLMLSDSLSEEQARDKFSPLFRQLFTVLLPRLCFVDGLSAEERDAFREQRHVIGDCLKDCVRIVGSSDALLLVKDALRTAQARSGDWRPVEAVLFALRTIASVVDRRESEVMPEVFCSLLALTQHPRLVYGVLLIVGCLSDWIRYHADVALGPSLGFVATGLGTCTSEPGDDDEVDIKSAAAQSMRYIGETCGALMVKHFDDLAVLYGRTLAGELSREDQLSFTECMCHVVAAAPLARHQDMLAVVSAHPKRIVLSPGSKGELVDVALEHVSLFIDLIVPEAASVLTPDYPTTCLYKEMEACFDRLLQTHGRAIDVGMTCVVKAAVVRLARGLGPEWLFRTIQRTLAWSLSGVFPGGLHVVRYAVLMCDCPAQVRAEIYTQIVAVPCSLDAITLLTALFDYFRDIPPPVVEYAQHAAHAVFGDPQSPSGDLSAAVHLTSRLLSANCELAGVLLTLLTNTLAGFSANVQAEVAALLHRAHRSKTEATAGAVLACIGGQAALSEREKEAWRVQWAEAVREPRPRALKSLVSVWASAVRRRLK